MKALPRNGSVAFLGKPEKEVDQFLAHWFRGVFDISARRNITLLHGKISNPVHRAAYFFLLVLLMDLSHRRTYATSSSPIASPTFSPILVLADLTAGLMT